MVDNKWYDIDDPTPNDDEIVIDKRKLDENGVDIYTKKSGEKTVEERIQTSRTLKIKHNNWNQVDYTEDFSNEKIAVSPQCYQYNSTYEDVEFQRLFQKIIENSKYKAILLGDDKVTINYQIVNDIILYCYARMKQDYTMAQICVQVCEYCGVSLPVAWKKLSGYVQLQVLEDLKEVSKLPNELLYNKVKLF